MSSFPEDTTPKNPEVDPLYTEMFGDDGLKGIDEPDRMEGQFEVIPRFNDYIVAFEAAKGRIAGTGNPGVSFGVRIVNGPEGTINRVVFDDLYLAVAPEGKTKDEKEKAREEIKATLVRLHKQMNLAEPIPRSFEVDELSRWGRQLIGKMAVVAVIVRPAGDRTIDGEKRHFEAKNRILWRSVAALDSQVLDKDKKPTGKTYKQRSDEEIAAYNAKQKGGPSGKGTTAAGFGQSEPTGFWTK